MKFYPVDEFQEGPFFIDLKSEAENYAKFMTIFWLMERWAWLYEGAMLVSKTPDSYRNFH